MKPLALIAYILNMMNGEIHGRIQLQKLIYFCKTYGTTVDANYRLYIYGPYSQQVADSLQDGVMDDIFHESKGLISKGTEFDEYFTNLSEKNPLCPEQQEILTDVLNTFGNMPSEQLEILATTFFIYRQQKSLFGTEEQEIIIDKVRRAKSSRFTEEQIISSYSKMKELCFPLMKKYLNV
ncbi:hypothetical protein B5G26_14950 [Anaerotignum lactatifermentans]|uniref:Antitoxin SocA-like Panacea domain-containing protein n=1 Tax=Anaerotignum lactatifermentans TaxID=160404 RepID=A0A1Y3TT58_9FIRM|nr:Panacea domain-containing protein [Anaerotignum lactatifermentans]OUN39751.1 hypothetical protein B5G26_14950 [Anaerotignum lactatifermentans]